MIASCDQYFPGAVPVTSHLTLPLVVYSHMSSLNRNKWNQFTAFAAHLSLTMSWWFSSESMENSLAETLWSRANWIHVHVPGQDGVDALRRKSGAQGRQGKWRRENGKLLCFNLFLLPPFYMKMCEGCTTVKSWSTDKVSFCWWQNDAMYNSRLFLCPGRDTLLTQPGGGLTSFAAEVEPDVIMSNSF